MKFFFSLLVLALSFNEAIANTWSYQVKVNSEPSKAINIDGGKSSFEAGPHYCEITPITINDNTEFRSLSCSVGSGSVSTGALCTKKGHKFPSVQYAILNLYGAKNLVNVVVSCHFD
jgi:hypothetical protein